MIIELKPDDKMFILELEKKFPDVFSIHGILDDFNNNKYTNYLVYLIDNKIVGFLNYYEIYERMEIINFNVLEYFQNRKIGSCLLDKLMEIAQLDKVTSITLEVRMDNEKALYLYKKYGFKELMIRKKYYGDVDGLLMEKRW